jgi:hypothetical protein
MHYKHYAARLTADPYYSAPEEAECYDGDFGSDYACERMVDAISHMIFDGQFETETGYFIDSYWADQIKQGDTDCEVEPWFMDFDFSSAPFWWLPYTYVAGEADSVPKPYNDVQEIYDEWFV